MNTFKIPQTFYDDCFYYYFRCNEISRCSFYDMCVYIHIHIFLYKKILSQLLIRPFHFISIKYPQNLIDACKDQI